MDTDKTVRAHVIALLDGHQAHMTFDNAVADFPPALINTCPPNVTYTPWHLIEHLRITQADILEYTRDPKYVSPEWPKGYWPSPDAQADMAMWNETIRQFRSDLGAMKAIIADPNTDLYRPIPHGYGGHTVLREALLIADHNAYHIGELGILRQVMDAWRKS
jgi:hypothetical protein